MPARDLSADVAALIGVESDLIWAPMPITQPFIDQWCAIFEDGHAGYTDPEFARSTWGGLIAPPLLMQATLFPYPWLPPALAARAAGARETRVSHILAEQMGLTGTVDLEIEKEWKRPLRPGDRVGVRRKVTAIDGPHQTPLGAGYITTYQAEYIDQRQQPVATTRTVIFTYKPVTGADRPLYRSRLPIEIYPDLAEVALPDPAEDPDVLPVLQVVDTFDLHVRVAAATRDFSRFHIDRDYARAHAQVEDVYASMLFIQGLISRYLTDWSGPTYRLGRLYGRIAGLVHPGDTITLGGRVARRDRDRQGERIELNVLVRTEQVTVLLGEATLVQGPL